jgi:hypothetical protein
MPKKLINIGIYRFYILNMLLSILNKATPNTTTAASEYNLLHLAVVVQWIERAPPKR